MNESTQSQTENFRQANQTFAQPTSRPRRSNSGLMMQEAIARLQGWKKSARNERVETHRQAQTSNESAQRTDTRRRRQARATLPVAVRAEIASLDLNSRRQARATLPVAVRAEIASLDLNSRRQARATLPVAVRAEITSSNSNSRREARSAQSPTVSQAERHANTNHHRQQRSSLRLQESEARDSIMTQLSGSQQYIGKPSPDILKEYEFNPQAALLFLADSTGFDVHADHFNGMNSGSKYTGGVRDLKNLHPVDQESLRISASDYLHQMRSELPISKCASCGEEKMGELFNKISLDNLATLALDQTSSRAERFFALPEDLRQCMTIYRHQANNCLYNLHENLLEQNSLGEIEASICRPCEKDLAAGKVPRYNVGNGFDFGRCPPELRLTIAEELVVSRCLRIQTTIKFVATDQEHIKGHCIFLPHDGNPVLARSLPNISIHDLPISVIFVGSKSRWRKHTETPEARRNFIRHNENILLIRPGVVLRWLRVKKMLDQTCQFEIDDSPSTVTALESIPELLLQSTIVMDDSESARTEVMTTANTAALDELPLSASEDSAASAQASEAILESVFVQPEVQQQAMADLSILQSLRRQLAPADQGGGEGEGEVNFEVEDGADDLREIGFDNETGDNVTASRTSSVSRAPAQIQIPVTSSAMNDFTENDKIFLGAFGHLFLLGEGAPNSGICSRPHVIHLLDQYDKRFAQSSPLIFTLFNQLQRSTTARQVSLRVKANHAVMARFSTLVNEDGFNDKLDYAIQNPNCGSSKVLIRLISELVTISGQKIPYSQMERESAYPRILAMKRHFGAFSYFVTVSPADMDSVLMMRLSHMDRACDDLNIPIQLPGIHDRLRNLARNPLAAATVYQRMMDAFFTHLIGLAPTHSTKSSAPPVDTRRECSLGIPIAYASVTELQARGSPHSHFLVTTDISPLTIQNYMDEAGFMQKFSSRVDSLVRCYIADDLADSPKVISSLPTDEDTLQFRDHRVPAPCVSLSSLTEFGSRVASATNMHTHSATCHKSHLGQRQCRLAMPRACFDDQTSCLQLVLANEDGRGDLTVRALQNIEPRNHQYQNDPLMRRQDGRNIVVELHRPGKPIIGPHQEALANDDRYRKDCPQGPNENCVAHSAVISACLRCNTDVEPLGNISQEKCATFYLLKYMTKAAYQLGNVLSIVKSARKHIEHYPSEAEDSGSHKRNAQHLLTRILNMQYGSVEISSQAAALALRGFPSNVYSHEFFYCFIRPAITWVRRTRGSMADAEETVSESLEYDRQLFIDRDVHEAQTPDIEERYELDESLSIVRGSDGRVHTIGQHEHYMLRGEDLKQYSLYEYCSIVSITKRTSGRVQSQGANQAGRNRNSCHEFSEYHLLHATHIQRLRSRQLVPILAGPAPPPHPGPVQDTSKWRTAANIFAEYVIVLFCPWNLQTHIPDVELTYEGLIDWMEQMEQSPSFVDKCRIYWIENLAQGMKIHPDTLKIMSAWRGRYAHVWTASDNLVHLATEKLTEKESCPGLSEELEMEADWAAQALDPDCELSKAAQSAHAIAETMMSMLSGLTPEPAVRINARRDELHEREMHKIFRRICDGTKESALSLGNDTIFLEEDEPDSDAGENELTAETFATDATQELIDQAFISDMRTIRPPVSEDPISQLNQNQNSVLVRVCQWFNSTYAELQPRVCMNLKILLSGAAGTGKSFLVSKIVARLGRDKVRCVSFQGIAASLLPGGQTIHSTFAISSRNARASVSSSKCLAARQSFGNAVLLIIDEISNTDARLFLSIDRRLREWFRKDLPFGGLGVIAMGDMFQIPPVAGISLAQSELTPGDQAGRLLAEFEMVQLSAQMRADDLMHQAQLEYFRNPLTSMRPVQKSDIMSTLKTIKASDYAADSTWYNAIMVVSENVTRVALNKSQAFIFARKHNQPVISWRQTLPENTKQIFLKASGSNASRLDEIIEAVPELTFYFVCGAPAVLKDNLWTAEGLVNGRMCKLHSLTLSGPTAAESWNRIDLAGAGEEVMLPVAPLSVNIELADASSKLNAMSLVEDATVLPFLVQPDFPRKLIIGKKLGYSARMGLKKVKLSYIDFGVDLAFAVTFHKVQGRTLDRVIVDLNGIKNMSIAAFYVAVSRTRRQEHIRLLPLEDRQISRKQLERKEFDPVLVEWLALKTSNERLLQKIRHWKLGDAEEMDTESRDTEDDDSAYFQSQRPRLESGEDGHASD